MPKKKNQHYVPQMYFRNFSDNGKSIGGYILKTRTFVRDMPISGICKRDYLYGDDLQIEEWFSKLEGQWAQVLRKIINQENLEITQKEYVSLLEFFFLSEVRTGYTADRENDTLAKICQTIMMLKRDHDQLDIDDKRIKKIKYHWDKPNLYAIKAMKKILPLFSDLEPLLIINNTSRQFITSDNPVIKYNYLFAKRNYHLPFGYGHVGILLFLPITEKICLMLYDPKAYDIINQNDSVLQIRASDQIIEINKQIAKNAKSALFFRNTAREWVVEKYAERIKDTHQNYNNHIIKQNADSFFVTSSDNSIFTVYNLVFCSIKAEKLHMPLPRSLAGPQRPIVKQLQESEKRDTQIGSNLRLDDLRILHEFD